MIDLFYRGEPLFMSLLTLLLFIILMMGVVMGFQIFSGKVIDVNQTRRRLACIKSFGLFTLVFGIFVQLLGLYGALNAIESWGQVSPAVLATGLWTSSIPSIYGLIIFLLAYLIWLGLTARLNRINISKQT